MQCQRATGSVLYDVRIVHPRTLFSKYKTPCKLYCTISRDFNWDIADLYILTNVEILKNAVENYSEIGKEIVNSDSSLFHVLTFIQIS